MQSQGAVRSHQTSVNCVKLPCISPTSRRQLVIARGEARSANRTKWTQKDLQTQQQDSASQKQQQYTNNITQLTQLDDAHDLVGVRLAAAVAAHQQQPRE